MKYMILPVIFTFVHISCDKEIIIIDSANIVGEWKLTEQLLDPGDGSCVFTKVTSDKTIFFLVDGSYKSNGTVCTIDADSNQDS
jgi:hypothetical protein